MTQLTSDMQAFLNEVHFAVVATIRADGSPHQTVMWYALQDDGTILLNTPFDSAKHRHLKRDPRLSVCVEDNYRYLTLLGTVRLNEDPQEAGQDYAALGRRYASTFAARSTSTPQSRPAILDRPRVTLLLTIDSIVTNRFK